MRNFLNGEQTVRRDGSFFVTAGAWVAAQVATRVTLPENAQPTFWHNVAEIGAGVLYSAVGVHPGVTTQRRALAAGAAFGAVTGLGLDILQNGAPTSGGEWATMAAEVGMGGVGGAVGVALATDTAPNQAPAQPAPAPQQRHG